jgi:hypothetical protein
MATLQGIIARQQETIEALEKDKLASIRLVEDLYSQRNERELVATREKNRAQLMTDAYQSMKLLGPIIINKLAGKKLLPEKASSKELIFKELAESLSPEQFKGILEKLSPAQQTALISLIESLGQFEREEDQTVKGEAH